MFEQLAKRHRSKEAPRALLSLATGSGKTFIAVNLLKKIADAGQLRRALFICDRDELRVQANAAFYNIFGANAAIVTKDDPQRNAKILIATYQTLDIESGSQSFLETHYPVNYFSHILIDECHRSAWGKWSEVLRRNPFAAPDLTPSSKDLLSSITDDSAAIADLLTKIFLNA